jgi:hypothetical protein
VRGTPAALLAALALGVSWRVAHAAEDDSDAASGAARPAVEESTEGALPGVPPDRAAPASKLDPSLDVEAGIDSYLQDASAKPRFGARAGAALERAEQRLRLEVGVERQPFVLRTWNFTDEDTETTDLRLTQSQDAATASIRWGADWTPRLSTTLELGGAWRWPDDAALERRSVDLDAGSSWRLDGMLAGWRLDVGLGGGLRDYPNYLVLDRRLDQRFALGSVGLVRRWGPRLETLVRYELRGIDYVDAHYDDVDADGRVTRADESKAIVRHTAEVRATWRPTRRWRARLGYGFERNDTSNYTREMTGRDADLDFSTRLIRDYEDYRTHTVEAGLLFKAGAGVVVELSADAMVRPYDTYQARSRDNVWLDETRLDRGWSVGVSPAWTFAEAWWGSWSVFAEARHQSHGSNMKRETSFATNYDVTRAFAGLRFER